jgi:hypothetical protein
MHKRNTRAMRLRVLVGRLRQLARGARLVPVRVIRSEPVPVRVRVVRR